MGYSRALRYASSLAVAVALVGPTSAAPPRKGQPYTLVIQGRTQATTLNYPSEAACENAKRKIISQFDQTPKRLAGGGIIVPAAPPQVFCVPR